MVGEEVIAFGMNPKGKGKGLKGMFADLKQHGIKDALGVGVGVLLADLGVDMLTHPKQKEGEAVAPKPMFEPLSWGDMGATLVAAIAGGYGGARVAGPRFGIAAMHGGMAILWQKGMASGKEEPLGNKIKVGYGSRLKAMFSGPKDDLLFIAEAGMSGTQYDEEGKLNGPENIPIVTE